MKITTPFDFNQSLDLYSPYSKAFVFADGEVCCWRCARDNSKLIENAIEEFDRPCAAQWRVIAVENVEEDNGECCANCNEKIYQS